jgi:hypothetical protein
LTEPLRFGQRASVAPRALHVSLVGDGEG